MPRMQCTQWVFDFEKIFTGFVIPPCQLDPSLRPSPAPVEPERPRRPHPAHPGRVPSPPAAPRPSGVHGFTSINEPSGFTGSGLGWGFCCVNPVGSVGLGNSREFPGKGGPMGQFVAMFPSVSRELDKNPFRAPANPWFNTIFNSLFFPRILKTLTPLL